jgi:RNA polymerase sigma factor (sigma-70 family)
LAASAKPGQEDDVVPSPLHSPSEAAALAALCRSVAAHHVKGRNLQAADREDFLQEFATRVFAPTFAVRLLAESTARRRGLLERMARLDLIDFLRRLRRSAHGPAEPLTSEDEHGARWTLEMVDAASDPARHLLRRCLHDELHTLLDEMHAPAREVFRLYYLENVPIAEICAQTGRSADAVKSCMFAGRRSLLARLTASGWGEIDVREALRLLGSPAACDVAWVCGDAE